MPVFLVNRSFIRLGNDETFAYTFKSSEMRISILKNLLTCALLAIVVFGCKKEDELAVPIVENWEVGTNNSKIAFVGSDLHLEGDVKAPAKIANIEVEISKIENVSGWNFSKSYATKYAGTLETNFHEHIDIPTGTPVGQYNLVLTVTDGIGRKTDVKSILTISN